MQTTNNIFHPAQWSTSDCLAALGTAVNLVLLLSLIFAAWQAVSAKKALKAQVLIKLIDEWKSYEVYKAFQYINRVRGEWKNLGGDSSSLAAQWVQQHMQPRQLDRQVGAEEENRHEQENRWRRTAAQFLAKTGVLMIKRYLTPDEYFSVVPELGRYLVVLIPIEAELMKFWDKSEGQPPNSQWSGRDAGNIPAWDHPYPKWEFNLLWPAYNRWFQKNQHRLSLHPIEWSLTRETKGT